MGNETESNKSKKSVNTSALSQGIAIGIAIGCAIGLALGNLAIGIGIGIALGVAIGSIPRQSKKGESENLNSNRRKRLSS